MQKVIERLLYDNFIILGMEVKMEELTREVAKVLSVLIAEKENYTYVDKLGYAPSKDLAIFYIREALRDFHSLIRGGRFDNSKAKDLAEKINFGKVERCLDELNKIDDKKALREFLAMISAKALSISATIMKEG